MAKNQWYKEAVEKNPPYTLGGWHKDQSAETRRKHALSSRTKYQCSYKKYLSAARALMALHNVSNDRDTKLKALSDAKYFYGKSRQHFE